MWFQTFHLSSRYVNTCRCGMCVCRSVYIMHACTFVWLLFYTVAIVFQLYHGSDMMYEMTRRKPKPTLLPTRGIF